MAQHHEHSPSRSGTVVYIATTTIAVQGPGNSASSRSWSIPSSSTNVANVYWVQTPAATQSYTSSDRDQRFETSRSQNGSPPSASTRTNSPLSSGLAKQDNGDQLQGNGNQRQDNGDQRHDNGDQRQDSHSHDSGGGDNNTIIIASVTAVVGILVAALLLRVFLKRRKNASYSEIIRFKCESDRMTALPTYQQDHDTIRDPETGLIGSMRETRPLTANSQSALAAKFLSPLKASATKPDQPPIASEKISSTEQPTGVPQRSKVAKRPASLNLPPMRRVDSTGQEFIGLSSNRSLRSVRSAKELSSPLDPSGARWSWTNSQAPSTPRIAPPNTRPSLTSLSVRSLGSWFSGQNSEDQPSSQRSHGRKRSNLLLLKNQAHRPVLAPRPSVRRPAYSLRTRAARLSASLASGRRSNASQRMDDQRPLTPSPRPLSSTAENLQ